MRSRYIVFSIAVFSFLYWFDFIISFGQPELNPLYSTTNKFIMFPIIISSVLLLNKFWNPKFKFATIFLISIFAFAFVWNAPIVFGQTITDSFENTTTENLNYCYRVPILNTCIQDTKSVETPTEWSIASRFNGTNFASDIDNIRSRTQVTDGLKSVTMWWIPANNCTFNPQSLTCGLLTQGYGANILSPIFTLPSDQFTLKIDSSVSSEYPVKCEGLFCVDEFYGTACKDSNDNVVFQTEAECIANGNTPFTIDAMGKIILFTDAGQFTVLDGLLDTKLPSDATFREIEIDLEPFLLSAGANNISVRFEITSSDPQFQFPISWTIDNLRFVEKEVAVSPAVLYIEEMTTFLDFPFTAVNCTAEGTTFTCPQTSFQVSRNFDGTAIGHISGTASAIVDSHGFLSDDAIEVFLRFNDGTSLNVTEASRGSFSIFAGVCGTFTDVLFPLVRPQNIIQVDVRINERQNTPTAVDTFVTYNFTFDASTLTQIRQTFGTENPTIINVEAITGVPHLYPAIQFNNTIDNLLFQNFNLYTFNPKGESIDLSYRLFDNVTQQLKNIDEQTSSAPSPVTIDFDGFRCPAEYDPAKRSGLFDSNDWINVSSIVPDSNDVITIESSSATIFTGSSFQSNTSTSIIPQAIGITVCESFCAGTTFNRAFEFTSGNITSCIFTVIPNDLNNCPLPVIDPTVPVEIFAFNQSLTEPVVDLALENTQFQFLNVFLTPLFIIFITMIGIAGFIEMKVKTNGTGFALAILSLTLFFTFVGIFPISVAIILIIISGLLLVRLIQQQFVAR